MIENGIENFNFQGIGSKELLEILKFISHYRSILKELEKRYPMIELIKFLIENRDYISLSFEEMYTKIEGFLNSIECNILSKTINQDSIVLYIQTKTGLVEMQINDSLFSDIFFEEAYFIFNKIRERDLSFLNGRDAIEVLEEVEEQARKGAYIQRYKGLGEMNPEQLWETTMTPANRTLLKVVLDDEQKADETFTLFMGDEVEPRRAYIQENAKNVKHLDV